MKLLALPFSLLILALSAAPPISPSPDTWIGSFGDSVALAQDECAVQTLARLTGRNESGVPVSERRQYTNWCTQMLAADRPGNAQSLASANSVAMICPGGGNCWCWNGTVVNGCDDYATTCKDELTCGPLGHVCICTQK